jgi:hypothetical protein
VGDTTFAGVSILSAGVSAGSALDVTVYLTGFADGESITVTLIFPDGSGVDIGTATGSSAGIAEVTLTQTLAAGVYAIEAEGNRGGLASTVLVAK